VQEQQRKEIETMIAAELSPILLQISRLESRLIGIDGNGSGREGVLQRQDRALTAIHRNLSDQDTKLDTLLRRSTTWDKAAVMKGIRNWTIVLAALVGAMLAYLTYHHTFFPHEPIFSFIATSKSTTTADSR
jgi:hypothetical protein